MIELTCMCEHKFSADIQEEYDAKKTPDLAEQVLAGTFMSVPCPSCGKLLKPEFPAHLIDKEKGWDIQFIPELERITFLKSFIPEKTQPKRIVIGYAELLEKVKILKDGLDDQVVEYLKYVILSKLLEKIDENENENDINVYYNESKEDSLLFHIQGLKKEEVGIFKIPFASYKDAAKDIKSRIEVDPFKDFLTPPYVSLNRLFIWDDV